MSATTPPPVVACSRCGNVIPGHIDTEIRCGRAVRECPRCRYPVDLEEVTRCQS